jgi:hypothetical protein
MRFSKVLAGFLAVVPCATICSASFAAEGAKGLYFDQLSQPKINMNTGMQYWIELHRGKQVLHANNKTAFQSGDRIAFHVRPNIDGYAYIVLKSGSKGEQAVLFPDAKAQEENRVQAGKEFVLPGDGMLAFDKNPGTEKLSVVLSRTPIDAQAYLGGPTPNSAQLVASADISGSKDLVPTQVLVSYNEPSIGAGSARTGTHDAQPAATKVTKSNTSPANATSTPPQITHKIHNTKSSSHSTLASASVDKAHNGADPGVVTVVYKDPSGVLAVDVSLMHR